MSRSEPKSHWDTLVAASPKRDDVRRTVCLTKGQAEKIDQAIGLKNANRGGWHYGRYRFSDWAKEKLVAAAESDIARAVSDKTAAAAGAASDTRRRKSDKGVRRGR